MSAFLYSGESHYPKLCVRRCNWPVWRICATILLASVTNRLSLRVGRFATRVWTRVARLFPFSAHTYHILTNAAPRLICNTCADARSNEHKNTTQQLIKVEKLRCAKLVCQYTKLFNLAFTVLLQEISAVCVLPAQHDLRGTQILK